MTNIWKLEKQVRAISLANRARRHDIARRWYVLGHAMATTAAKPVVLGSAVLAGFCLGFRENQPSAYGKNRGVRAKILPLAMSYLVHTARHDKLAPTNRCP